MKKKRISIVVIIAAQLMLVMALLPACTNEKPANEPYRTTVDGQDLTVMFNEGTKSEGTISSVKGDYAFSCSIDGTLSITYPNGFLYTQRNFDGGTIAASLDDEAVNLGYIDGMSLGHAINAASSQGSTTNTKAVSPFVSVLLVAVGAIFIFAPKGLWWLSRGWMYKNVEPSDLALGIYRAIGVVVVIVGVISFFA